MQLCIIFLFQQYKLRCHCGGVNEEAKWAKTIVTIKKKIASKKSKVFFLCFFSNIVIFARPVQCIISNNSCLTRKEVRLTSNLMKHVFFVPTAMCIRMWLQQLKYSLGNLWEILEDANSMSQTWAEKQCH